MKYDIDWVVDSYNNGEELDFLFFWGHRERKDGKIGKGVLSQWWPADFKDEEGVKFSSAEQYMMYKKAILFKDWEIAKEILQTRDPRIVKKLGREVKNFRKLDWDRQAFEYVVRGNYLKFSQNKDLKDFLIATGSLILVEASPYDDIWGVGLLEASRLINNPNKWPGLNLLGFALMEVRDRLREEMGS